MDGKLLTTLPEDGAPDGNKVNIETFIGPMPAPAGGSGPAPQIHVLVNGRLHALTIPTVTTGAAFGGWLQSRLGLPAPEEWRLVRIGGADVRLAEDVLLLDTLGASTQFEVLSCLSGGGNRTREVKEGDGDGDKEEEGEDEEEDEDDLKKVDSKKMAAKPDGRKNSKRGGAFKAYTTVAHLGLRTHLGDPRHQPLCERCFVFATMSFCKCAC